MRKLLLISRSPIKDTNGVGNTYSNIFSGYSRDNLFNLFCRNDLPDNGICDKYYQITENQILMNILTPENIGTSFCISDVESIKTEEKIVHQIEIENKLLDYFRKNRSSFFLLARDLLWNFGNWKNDKFKSFLLENEIDTIFVLVSDCQYLFYLLNYCKKITNAKIVLFFADDVYSYLSFSPIEYLYKLSIRRKIRRVVGQASLLYGASEELCNEYGQIFHKEIKPLYKGCDFENVNVKKKVNNPIIISYAGNLLYGRDKVLSLLANEIKKSNVGAKLKVILNIYTQATINEKLNKSLNIDGVSYLKGGLPYNEIKRVLSDSDIVLHVESNDQKQKKITRLSFSTKIIDCMQSGSCMLAIGPLDVASMKYIINHDIAFVATNKEEIKSILQHILNSPESILAKAMKMRKFAKNYHNITNVRESIIKDCDNFTKI